MRVWRAARAAPALTGIGMTCVVPWYLMQTRPEAEYVQVQQVDVSDVAGTRAGRAQPRPRYCGGSARRAPGFCYHPPRTMLRGAPETTHVPVW